MTTVSTEYKDFIIYHRDKFSDKPRYYVDLQFTIQDPEHVMEDRHLFSAFTMLVTQLAKSEYRVMVGKTNRDIWEGKEID